MARKVDSLYPSECRLAVFACLILAQPAASSTMVEHFLAAADQGHCIESVAYRLIHDQGPANATGVVKAALEAYGQRERQQRVLGCAGDIAAQAIAAGAEPDQVLQATAAGL